MDEEEEKTAVGNDIADIEVASFDLVASLEKAWKKAEADAAGNRNNNNNVAAQTITFTPYNQLQDRPNKKRRLKQEQVIESSTDVGFSSTSYTNVSNAGTDRQYVFFFFYSTKTIYSSILNQWFLPTFQSVPHFILLLTSSLSSYPCFF